MRERRAITALKRGEIDALHYLYVCHASAVYGVVKAIVKDHHTAEDVTQSIFTKLPKVISRYEERAVPFAAWLNRVSRNAALDYLRAHRNVPVPEVRITDPAAGTVALERSQALREALARLPQEQRSVVAMRHIAGMSPSEIAERLGKSEPSVHGLHHRGRAALKETLGELEVAPTTAA